MEGHPVTTTTTENTKPEIKFSEAWCVCLADLLTNGHDKWPVRFPETGEPRHWCPECYDEGYAEYLAQQLKDDGVDVLALPEEDEWRERYLRWAHEHALDYSGVADYRAGNAKCHNGHTPPEQEKG